MSATFVLDALEFHKIFRVICKSIVDINIKYTAKGLFLLSGLDKDHISFFEITLPKEVFSTFEVEAPYAGAWKASVFSEYETERPKESTIMFSFTPTKENNKHLTVSNVSKSGDVISQTNEDQDNLYLELSILKHTLAYTKECSAFFHYMGEIYEVEKDSNVAKTEELPATSYDGARINNFRSIAAITKNVEVSLSEPGTLLLKFLWNRGSFKLYVAPQETIQ